MASRSLFWPDPRVKPPFGAAEIDWGHPLAVGLISFRLFGDSIITRDLVGGGSLSLSTGTPLIGTRSFGVGTTYDGSTRQVGPAVRSACTLGISTMARFCFDSRNGYTNGGILQDYISYGVGNFALIFHGAANIFRFYILGSGESESVATAVSGPVPGTTYVLVGTFNIGTQAVNLYANGVLGTGAAGPATWVNRNQSVFYGGTFYNTYSWITLSDVGIWGRDLSASEVLWLSAEPYAMLRPIVRRRYFVPAVVGIAIPVLTRQYRERWS